MPRTIALIPGPFCRPLRRLIFYSKALDTHLSLSGIACATRARAAFPASLYSTKKSVIPRGVSLMALSKAPHQPIHDEQDQQDTISARRVPNPAAYESLNTA